MAHPARPESEYPFSLYDVPLQNIKAAGALTPRSRTIRIPFPTTRLAETALRALAVDQELSQLVRRSFSLASALSTDTPHFSDTNGTSELPFRPAPHTNGALPTEPGTSTSDVAQETNGNTSSTGEKAVLVTHYSATTNRMLRVAVNGFFESVGVVIACMRELDVDVVGDEWIGDGDDDIDQLRRVQGLEEMGPLG